MKKIITLWCLLAATVCYAQTGNVGIGTTTPLARLHVTDSSVLFSATGDGPTLGNVPISGAGRRLMWHSYKAAFRVGGVLANNWDDINVGAYSFGSGYNTKASGTTSTALGFGTVASGPYSTAIGFGATATGDNSIALGISGTAPSYGETVTGIYPTTYTPASTTAWNAADRLFVIGNGSGFGLTSNALTVLKNGNTGIGTSAPDANAILDVTSNSKGLLLPRLALTATNNASPLTAFVAGMVVYNTVTASPAPNNVVPGYYFSDGTKWLPVLTNASGWSLTGNAGTNPATNFIGTTDDKDLVFVRNNVRAGLITSEFLGNTSWGSEALNPAATGYDNTANGYQSLFSNTIGDQNTANGSQSLLFNTTGHQNTANGFQSLYNNTTGAQNTANGYGALRYNTTADGNTANGYQSLFFNVGSRNTAQGFNSLVNNTTGNDNVAMGTRAMLNNNTGNSNVAVGVNTLYNSISGSGNVAIGYQAGYSETGSNKLYIANDNSDANSALVYGQFTGMAATQLLQVNGRLKVNMPDKAVALDMGSGAVVVNTSTASVNPFVFTVTATAATLDLVIPNTTQANSASDILIITHRLTQSKLPSSPGVYWNGSNWVIFLESGANHIVNEKYNVMVIKTQ